MKKCDICQNSLKIQGDCPKCFRMNSLSDRSISNLVFSKDALIAAKNNTGYICEHGEKGKISYPDGKLSCTCHDGNNDCKEHPIKTVSLQVILTACADLARKQACQEMIKYMEDNTFSFKEGRLDVINAAKEYLKTL